MRVSTHSTVVAALFIGFTAFTAQATIPTAPSIKPDIIAASKVVSTTDAGILRSAINAVDDNNWSRVRVLETQARNETVRELIRWYRGRGDVVMSFDELSFLLRSQADCRK